MRRMDEFAEEDAPGSAVEETAHPHHAGALTEARPGDKAVEMTVALARSKYTLNNGDEETRLQNKLQSYCEEAQSLEENFDRHGYPKQKQQAKNLRQYGEKIYKKSVMSSSMAFMDNMRAGSDRMPSFPNSILTQNAMSTHHWFAQDQKAKDLQELRNQVENLNENLGRLRGNSVQMEQQSLTMGDARNQESRNRLRLKLAAKKRGSQ